MPYQLTIEPRAGYLHARVTGDNSSQTVLAYLAEIRLIMEQQRCLAVLIEENLTGPGLDTVAIFDVVTQRVSQPGPSLRIAYVDTNPAHNAKLMKFAETVAVNRGMNVRVFPTVLDAERWISARQ